MAIKVSGTTVIDDSRNLTNIESVAGNGIATQSEAETGTNNDQIMTPLRVAQAIAAIGGNVGGTVIKYPSGGSSPFVLSLAHVTSNITLDASIESIDYKAITQEDKIVVDNGVTVTVGEKTTVIPDLFVVP